jgi:hypothetical protein
MLGKFKDPQDRQVLRAPPVRKDLPVPWESLVRKVHRDHKVHKDHKELLGHKGLRDRKVRRELT